MERRSLIDIPLMVVAFENSDKEMKRKVKINLLTTLKIKSYPSFTTVRRHFYDNDLMLLTYFKFNYSITGIKSEILLVFSNWYYRRLMTRSKWASAVHENEGTSCRRRELSRVHHRPMIYRSPLDEAHEFFKSCTWFFELGISNENDDSLC